MSSGFRFLLVSLAVLFVPGGAAAQAVLTEDFESPPVSTYWVYPAGQHIVTATNDWLVTEESVDLFNGFNMAEADAYDGAQAIDLTGSPGPGSMETSFGTTPGTEYELIFYYARNQYNSPDSVMAKVEVVGAAPRFTGFVLHHFGYDYNDYRQYQAHFTADSTETLLRFTSLTPGVAGITLDGVSVTEAAPVGIGPGGMAGSRDHIPSAQPNPFRSAVTLDYETAEENEARHGKELGARRYGWFGGPPSTHRGRVGDHHRDRTHRNPHRRYLHRAADRPSLHRGRDHTGHLQCLGGLRQRGAGGTLQGASGQSHPSGPVPEPVGLV